MIDLSAINMGARRSAVCHGVGWAVVGIVVLKVFVSFVVLLIATMFMVWFERKVISDMQNRIGPNRAGPFGLLQTLADGMKLFFKEDLFPERADKQVFRLAPYLSVVPAFLGLLDCSDRRNRMLFGHDTRLQLADPPVGILWLLVMSSVLAIRRDAGWLGVGLEVSIVGSVRASAQMVSYEAALGLSVAAVVLVTGALETSSIVAHQIRPLIENSWLPSWVHSWNLWLLPLCRSAFLLSQPRPS